MATNIIIPIAMNITIIAINITITIRIIMIFSEPEPVRILMSCMSHVQGRVHFMCFKGPT